MGHHRPPPGQAGEALYRGGRAVHRGDGMSAFLEPGQRCLLVWCDRATGEAAGPALELEAVITHFSPNGDVNVAPDTAMLRDGTWVATRFGLSDGYNTYGWERTWRLTLPADRD